MFNTYIKKIILSFAFLILSSNLLSAQDFNQIFEEGNRFYQSGDYENAIEAYNRIIEAGYESAALYLNLGNTYFREGKIGYAILNYERALKLSPGDEDVKHNLAFANAQTRDRPEPMPSFFIFEWWESLLALFSLSGWVYLSYSVFILLLLSSGLYLAGRKIIQQRYSFFAALGLAVILACLSIISGVKYMRETRISSGIIIQPAVNVKLSPDARSNDAFVIHEGLKVTIEDKVDNWLRIRLLDGKVGWLEEKELEII